MLFEAGSKAYLEGNWDGSLKHWLQIEQSGYHSGELYYNIGNASFKSGKLGQAILYWEKSARLMGEDGDLAANLKVARERLVDDLSDSIRLPVWDWFDNLRKRFSGAVLTGFSIVLCFLAFAMISLRRWVIRSSTSRRRILIPIWIIIVILVFDLLLLGLHARDDMTQREGIMLASEAQVLSAPTQGTGKLLFTLHEGTKVRVFRILEGWYEISAGKNMQGWVKKGTLGII